MSKSRLTTAAVVAVSGLLLTGCGSASPGIAATVGDDQITVRQVDEATDHYCTAVGQLDSEVPMGFVRQYVVQALAVRSQASQIADAYGVEPGTSYADDVAQREATAATKPAAVRDDFVEVASTTAYAQDILDQVGRLVLADQGVADPTLEQVSQAGLDVFNQWPDANGIEIDPRFGIDVVDGVLTPVDTNTSVAVSDTAKAGLSSEPDPVFAASLPDNQRCG